MGTQLAPEKGYTHPYPDFGPCLLSIVAKRLDGCRMETPLGTEVDLGTGHIELDVVPVICERGTAAPPLFSSMSIVATAELLFFNGDGL